MERSVWITLHIWMLFILLTVQCYPRGSPRLKSGACDRCKPGYYASTPCSRRHGSVCEPCPDDHFTASWNVLGSCHPCSQCGEGRFQLKPCTKTSNVVCETCSVGAASRNKDYHLKCLDVASGVVEMQADYPMVTASSENQTSSVKGETFNNSKNEKDDFTVIYSKTEPIYEQTTNNINEEVNNSKHDEVVNFTGTYRPNTTEPTHEESTNNNHNHRNGTTDEKDDFPEVYNITSDKSNNEMETILYGSDLGLTESSGYVFEEKEVVLDFSEFLENNITVNPSEAAEDELIPVYAIPRPTDRRTRIQTNGKGNTSHTVDIVEGSGLVVEDASSGSYSNNVSRVEHKETQTDKWLETDYSGEGIIIPDDKDINDSSNSTKYTVLESSSVRIPQGKRKGEHGNTAVLWPDGNIQASKEEQQEEINLKMSGTEGRRRTAIIVGVAVGAAALFVIGVVTSRYCKKHKVFTVIPKSPRNNKCTSENGNVEGLQFHDLRPGMCIYNEPDETGSVKIKLLPSDGDSLEKSKDISSTKINHDSFINGIEKLKYMDETDDEAELATAEDKLLGESSTKELLQPSSPELRNSTESAESKNTDDNRVEAEMSSDSTLADGVMSKLNEKLAPIEDERTPMLPKDEDKDAASKS